MRTVAGRRDLNLLPVEMMVVDRGDPIKDWSSAETFSFGKPIYAGEFTGDMVSWKIGGTDALPAMNFAWSAEGPNGQSIRGPSGTGKNEWKIADGDEDAVDDWLKWKPGKWKIKVKLGSTTTEFEQEVGWRTDEWIAVGQIVPTQQFSLSADQKVLLREAFYRDHPYDVMIAAIEILLAPYPIAHAAFVLSLAMPEPDVVALGWAGYWGYISRSTDQIRDLTYLQRRWVGQQLLNRNPDIMIQEQGTWTKAEMDAICNAKEYRINSRFQQNILVDENGDIKSVNGVPPTRASIGLTKLVAGLKAGDLFDAYGFQFPPSDWQFSRWTEEAEASPYHATRTVAADKKSVSLYASGRVGEHARKVNWRLTGRDVPWIYVETVFKRQDQFPWFKAQPRASMTVVVEEDESKPFNNLSFFTRDYTDRDFPYIRKKLLPMEGHVGEFIDSGSLTWPGTAPTPYTK